MKFLNELKEFAIKGNMFDMAIGIIIGAAFSKIVTSLVHDLIMPALGFLIGKVNFRNLKVVLQEEATDNSGNIVQELIAINYGNFIQVIFDFSIIALTIFIIIRVFNTLRKKAEDEKETSVPTPKNIELLAEIRDILSARGGSPDTSGQAASGGKEKNRT
ncbi:MAG: large-conductance mechanosensitive channel protein MscL [Bacteroidetes bacterium]|nr:large-conductance mechanosensitive channel protein MscL [Bacteroidota bacterium]